ncbi:hypothetical protein BJP40_13315 [Streptomyces sp. CC53]|uniref:hypothetical protein n=1 Tax=Streptomyces sp. CC53 TaxID=1906740 RepID=UPI0008DE018E|nr:hypothetical protein [Streptomyces sp. CC53]OII59589.1 hypothetical protein BJP40_13315 [Streptomyces sp. CC53]
MEDASHLMPLAAWYAFGALSTEAFGDGVPFQAAAFAVLVLSVARFVPVAVSLAGTSFTRG